MDLQFQSFHFGLSAKANQKLEFPNIGDFGFDQFTQTSTAVTNTTGSTEACGYICEEGNPSFVTPTSYVTESGTATSSESGGYASEYILSQTKKASHSQARCVATLITRDLILPTRGAVQLPLTTSVTRGSVV